MAFGDRDMKKFKKSLDEARLVVKASGSGKLPKEMAETGPDNALSELVAGASRLVGQGRRSQVDTLIADAKSDASVEPASLWIQLLEKVETNLDG